MAFIVNGSQEIEIVNIQENENISSTVTQYPVEKGSPISDHTQISSKTMQVSGYLFGDSKSSSEAKYNALQKFKNEGKLVEFKGRIYLKNLAITDVSKSYDKIGNGFAINISFTVIREAKVSWSKIPNNGKKQPTTPKNPEVYVTVKRGNTYWGWWKQYGTPIQTLRNWNKWPDRFIPIGARARVK